MADPGSESTQTDEVKRLKAQVEILTEKIKDMTTNDAIADSLGYGFRDLVAKLQPLRELPVRPNGEKLPRKTAIALKRLREAITSPDWSNAGALPIDEKPVRWIGQPDDADGDEPAENEDGAFAVERRVAL